MMTRALPPASSHCRPSSGLLPLRGGRDRRIHDVCSVRWSGHNSSGVSCQPAATSQRCTGSGGVPAPVTAAARPPARMGPSPHTTQAMSAPGVWGWQRRQCRRGEDLPRPVRVGAEPGDRQIGALRGGFLPSWGHARSLRTPETFGVPTGMHRTATRPAPSSERGAEPRRWPCRGDRRQCCGER